MGFFFLSGKILFVIEQKVDFSKNKFDVGF
jgi:hypothetical protein